MKGQASVEILFSFIAMLLITSLIISSFPKSFEKVAEKLSQKQEKNKMAAALSAYYLTGGQASQEVKCVSSSSLTVFNEKINSFLCSVRASKRWFLK